ncbi:hypothetical protein QFZ27_007786 [Inquilinus ginsengisoli]|uniref:hypothetical protein n=1 Tax=Inquilinus ginsengisoli TaxID=363840 RepID=UPI003D22083C
MGLPDRQYRCAADAGDLTGNIIMYVKTDEAVGLNFGSFGATGNSGRGGNVQGLQLTNAGKITLDEASTTGGQTYGIRHAVQHAGAWQTAAMGLPEL